MKNCTYVLAAVLAALPATSWARPFVHSLSVADSGPVTPTPAASSAIEYPASGVELLSQVPLGDFGPGASSGADCWGYTSPSGTEYALMGVFNGTGFVNISDPGDPQIVAVIPGPSSSWRDIKTYQDHAYVINESGGGLQVIDMSQIDSGIVTELGAVDTPGTSATHNVAVNEESGFLYRLGGGGGTVGMRIYDLTVPGSPTFVGEWHDRYIHDAQIVTYHGGPFDGREIAFCFSEDTSSGGNPGIDILDVTDKSSITSVSFLEYSAPRAFSHQGWLTPDRNYVYMNDELDEQTFGIPTTTRIINVSDLTSPFEAGLYEHPTDAIDHNLYIKGNLLYAANYRSGLRILDITNPTTPVETAFFDTYPADDAAEFNGLWSNYPFFDSGIVIGSDIEQGLFVWWIGSRQLEYTYPDGQPQLLHPDGQAMRVSVTENGGTLDASSLRLVTNDGSGPVESALVSLGGDFYEATFPASDCGGSVNYFLTGQSTDGITWQDPASGAASPFFVSVAIDQAVELTDDMETASGWTSGAPGDTATTGIWERVNPNGTGAQPEDDHTDAPGTDCWVTGQGSVGGGLGANDVDDGKTTLLSPVIDLQAVVNPKIGYWRWYSNNAGGSPGADVFVVDITADGSNWFNVETVGPSGEGTGGGWLYHEFLVNEILPSFETVQLRFIAEDAGGGSIIEAAIDDLQVLSVDCGFAAVTPATAPAPHDFAKNRYISFVPNNGDVPVAFDVELPDGRQAWVGEPQQVNWAGDDEAFVSLLVDAPVVREWDEPVVHVYGCAVVPDALYPLRASDGGAQFTDALELATVPEPQSGSWADVVGSFDGSGWTAPNGFVNFSDVDAAVKKFQQDVTAAHVTVIDLEPQWPNYFVNFNDINMIIRGFQGQLYPVGPDDFQTVADCPLGAAP